MKLVWHTGKINIRLQHKTRMRRKSNASPPVLHPEPWKTESSSAACHIFSKHVLQVYWHRNLPRIQEKRVQNMTNTHAHNGLDILPWIILYIPSLPFLQFSTFQETNFLEMFQHVFSYHLIPVSACKFFLSHRFYMLVVSSFETFHSFLLVSCV